MSDAAPSDDKVKWDRSPTYPFISLRKAEERAKQFWNKHRREPARLGMVADTWGYGVKSSGLQQTIGALKQYGLLEDLGSGDERKVQLTDLARRLIVDEREGAREAARREAAMRPRLFQEYKRYVGNMPSDSHFLSELELDRGFNPAAAQAFLKAFVETASWAALVDDDTLSSTLEEMPDPTELTPVKPALPPITGNTNIVEESDAISAVSEIKPLNQRLKVQFTIGSISINAVLQTAEEVDTVIKILEANKALLSLAGTTSQ
jgi:hypothetical protein